MQAFEDPVGGRLKTARTRSTPKQPTAIPKAQRRDKGRTWEREDKRERFAD